jgi:hypothetical protein
MWTREERNEYYREWRKRHAERLGPRKKLERRKAHEALMADPERKAVVWARTRKSEADLRLKVLDRLGCKCVACGETDPIVLQIDHVHSDGSVHRARKNTRAIYKEMLATWDSGRWQALCCNCNAIKRHLRREWSSGRKKLAKPPTDPKKAARYAYMQAYYDRPGCRERIAKVSHAGSSKARQLLLAAYGGRCARCGFDDQRALHIDHVHSNGHSHRKEVSSPHVMRKQMLAAAGNGDYQILCAGCNCRKARECGETCLGKTPRLSKRQSAKREAAAAERAAIQAALNVSAPLATGAPPHHNSPSSEDQKPAIVPCVSS